MILFPLFMLLLAGAALGAVVGIATWEWLQGNRFGDDLELLREAERELASTYRREMQGGYLYRASGTMQDLRRVRRRIARLERQNRPPDFGQDSI